MGSRCAVLGMMLLAACEAGPIWVDDGGTPCSSHAECDDGVFCNGFELCLDGPAGSTCARGGPPCAGGCDEEGAGCADCVPPDADGDGRAAIGCGGDDCDDADPARAPGRAEVCDDARHDEDCIPSSVGLRDEDGDGVVSAACCNGVNCGPDCDDSDPAARPGASEACDGRDDDCDGATDESPAELSCMGLDGVAEHTCDGLCTVGRCIAGRADCDGNPTNGCERSLSSDQAHCGTCGHACDEWLACVDGECAPSVDCWPGSHACAWGCAPDWDPANCGSRCEVCPVPDGGFATCDGSACGLRCDGDDLLVETGPGAPRCVGTSTGTLLMVVTPEATTSIWLAASPFGPPSVRVSSSVVTITVGDATRAATVRIGDEVRTVGESFSPITIAPGLTTLDVESTSETGDRATQRLELLLGWEPIDLAGTDVGDLFGTALAIDGDLLVVGAPGEAAGSSDPTDGSMPGAGAAYVFEHRGDEWMRVAFLKAADPAVNARFGQAVAISGDLVAVGAPGVAGDQGAVYLFSRAAGWAQVARLTAWAPDHGDRFGSGMALGPSTLLVGAPGEDGGGLGLAADPEDDSRTDAGAAYSFRMAAGSWISDQYFKHPRVTWISGNVALAGDVAVLGDAWPVVYRRAPAWRLDGVLETSPSLAMALRSDGAAIALVDASGISVVEHAGFGWSASRVGVGASPVAFSGDRIVFRTWTDGGRTHLTFHRREGTRWIPAVRLEPTGVSAFGATMAASDRVVAVGCVGSGPFDPAEAWRGHVLVYTP